MRIASPSVTLLMAMHCHQPVGNFDDVFADAYRSAYEPFLTILSRHPSIHVALHYSGSLLDWLMVHEPAFLDRLHVLVQRGQVELLASGYYEPILPLLPEEDRQGQMALMRRTLKRRFGAEVSGLWLTERVWEPDLPSTLARAGMRYTILDANQFAPARPWIPEASQLQDGPWWDVFGYYTTEHTGHRVAIFPASKRLRYAMPFLPVDRTIEFFRRLQGRSPCVVTFADDGEKFGFWPKTHQWVYGEGWLEQFFSALEREQAWLLTATFDQVLKTTAPSGGVYLPTGSYEEMLEWSGGFFRNFFVKYPEANAMQQKMLRVSRELAELQAAVKARITPSKGRALLRLQRVMKEAQRHLYMAQCNCAYWHGVFGGLYLTHLRRAVYAHLITAEHHVMVAHREWLAMQRATHRMSSVEHRVEEIKASGAGSEGLLMRTERTSLLVNPHHGGTVTEWSLTHPPINLLDTVSRRYEAYHERLRVPQRETHGDRGGVPSIHETVGVKDAHLGSLLVYDRYRRSAFVESAAQAMPTLKELLQAQWDTWQGWEDASYHRLQRVRTGDHALRVVMDRPISPRGNIQKTILLSTRQALVEWTYRLTEVSVPVVALESTVALRDSRYLHEPQRHDTCSSFQLQEPELGVILTLTVNPPATLFHFPLETVSESEGGLERTYQGLCVFCCWEVGAVASWQAHLQWRCEEE